MSAGSEVERAVVGHGLVVAEARKVPGWRDGNLRGDGVAFLKRICESMERSVTQTTNQTVRQL